MLKVCEAEAINGTSSALSQYRENATKLPGISTRTVSCIEAEPEKDILPSRKPHIDIIKLGDFDKCLLRMADRKKAIRSLARQVAANVLKVCEAGAMNGTLSAPLLQYRENATKLPGISTRTLSCIEAEPEKEILASRKSRIDIINFGNFDKFCLFLLI